MSQDTAPRYADFITKLPLADLPFAGVRANLLAAPLGQVAFFTLPAGMSVPAHSHGAQWGIVVAGGIELTIGGVKGIYRQGDSYHVGDGVVHSVVVLEDCLAIDVFADPDRYRPKP
jgi:quercetin dioxygenase-like cupin family protein